MSAADIIILAVIGLCVLLAIRKIRKGGSGCSGNCAACMEACCKKRDGEEKTPEGESVSGADFIRSRSDS
ncbi:MAG: FeoB-associated Cys-rich membrane protein [Candidatus Limivicinus sp.]